jgi:hypothetical protein
MSIDKIPLRKLLQLFYADRSKRRSILLADIRNDKSKEHAEEGSGGDFYVPFWADAKNHVLGRLDLVEQSKFRIAKNARRTRLYPKLAEGFLKLWNEKVRWRNEKFELFPENVKAILPIEELEAHIRIENTVSVKIWDGSDRVIYPYFSETPALPEEGARLGLWVLRKALPDFHPDSFRIVDVLRSAYFRPTDITFSGSERDILVQKYRDLLNEWKEIQDER